MAISLNHRNVAILVISALLTALAISRAYQALDYDFRIEEAKPGLQKLWATSKSISTADGFMAEMLIGQIEHSSDWLIRTGTANLFQIDVEIIRLREVAFAWNNR